MHAGVAKCLRGRVRGGEQALDAVARTAYEAVDAAGMARIDFFVERGTGRLLLNEINASPGFTCRNNLSSSVRCGAVLLSLPVVLLNL